MSTTRKVQWVALGMQVAGALGDLVWHVRNPEQMMAPLWVHLPIYAGILLLAGATVVRFAGGRAAATDRVIAAAVSAQAVAAVWSIAVQAEAQGFYVPAVLIALGGFVAFGALTRAALVARGRSRVAVNAVGR
jgi:hypothetical protein